MFEQTFKNIDDTLWKDAGCSSELDYIEQTSWILFLKYLNDLEGEKQLAAELKGKTYQPIISPEFRWESWAVPKTKDGEIDHNRALTGDDLLEFVNQKLFPYLKNFKVKATDANTIEYKIGEIFSEITNKIQSGYTLRAVLNHANELRFRSHAEKYQMSVLYEEKIRNMGNAGRNGGEYYTPRPLIKTIVKVVDPKIGNSIYDGAVGSAGFLVEAYNYLKASKELTTADAEKLQKDTFFGKEKKSLAYIIGIMNMILHGIEAPNILHTNTLTENIMDIQEKDRYDVVLTNPPFGGKERTTVKQNFPIKTGETAYLFLQHFIKILTAGGKAGIVIKNTFLSNSDNASISLRKQLLETCDLHTVLVLPGGVFTGAGVKTVVLFFEKGKPTKNIWFYQLNLNRSLGKTDPLNEADLQEFLELQKQKAGSDNSWNVDIGDMDQDTFDMSVRNPNKNDEDILRDPRVILEEIKKLDRETEKILVEITKLYMKKEWVEKKLGDLFDITSSKRVYKSEWKREGVPFYRAREIVKLAKQGYVDNELFISEEMFSDYSSNFGFPKAGDIMVTGVGTLGICYVVKQNDKFYFKDGNIIWLKKKSEVNSRYIEYAFQSNILRKQIDNSVGATVGTYTIIKAKNTRVPIPPLPEQRRIVAVLDQALEAIDKTIENTEENLLNSRELFKSYVNNIFTNPRGGWEIKKLGNVCENLDSKRVPVTKRDRHKGIYPYYGASGIVDYINDYIFDEDLLLVSEDGANLLARTYPIAFSISGKSWVNNHAHVLKFENLPTQRFVEYFLNSIKLDEYVTGMAQPKLNQKMLNSIAVPFPNVKIQNQVVNRLDTLSTETKNLDGTYRKKLVDLEELRQSFLHKAFVGEL